MTNFLSGVCIVATLILSSGCQKKDPLPYFTEATFTPVWAPTAADLKTLHVIPAFSLTNQNGARFESATLAQKPYVASFFFTSCPGICPRMVKNLKGFQAELEDVKTGFNILSFTVTPKIDTPEVLKAFVGKKAIDDSNWTFLTGDRQEIYTLGRKGYFIEEDLGEERSVDEFIHTENVVLIDQNGHLRGVYNGLNRTSMTTLVQDMRRLLSHPPS